MSDARVPFEALDAYQSGDMPDAEAAGFEEELFAAAATGAADEARFVDLVSRLGRFLEGRGGFDIGSSRARVDDLLRRGVRVQLIELDPAPVLRPPPIDDDAEIVVSHIRQDLRGYDSIDVVVEKADGTVLKTFRDIGWDPIDGSVYAVCEAPLARISAQQKHIRSRVLATKDGETQTIAVFETIQP